MSTDPKLLLFRVLARRLVLVPPMRAEHIHAEVAHWIAPHRVNVVGVPRGVVVLHQQTMALDAQNLRGQAYTF